MVLRCAWGTCNVDERYPERLQNGVKLILFPKPKTNLQKCLRWIKACGRPHEQLNIQRINKHKATAGYNLMFMTVVHTESYNYYSCIHDNFWSRTSGIYHTCILYKFEMHRFYTFVKLGYFIHIARDGN